VRQKLPQSQSATPIYLVSKLAKTHYLHFVDLSLQESLALAPLLRAENKLDGAGPEG
jgi:hypothetical protein